jgi:hypothetical protein
VSQRGRGLVEEGKETHAMALIEAGRTMNVTDLLQAIKRAPQCYVWVRFIPEEGLYVQVSKVELAYRVQQNLNIEEILAHCEDEVVYVN